MFFIVKCSFTETHWKLQYVKGELPFMSQLHVLLLLLWHSLYNDVHYNKFHNTEVLLYKQFKAISTN